jgi:hypothetical protein
MNRQPSARVAFLQGTPTHGHAVAKTHSEDIRRPAPGGDGIVVSGAVGLILNPVVEEGQ